MTCFFSNFFIKQPPKPLDESLVLVANTKIQKANVNVELVHSFDHGRYLFALF